MLDKFKLLSVNQLAAKIKIIEVWKINNCENYPLGLDMYNQNLQHHELRAQPNRVFKDDCRLHKSESSFHIDAARLWNATPDVIRLAVSLEVAKKAADVSVEHFRFNPALFKTDSRQMAPFLGPSLLKKATMLSQRFFNIL